MLHQNLRHREIEIELLQKTYTEVSSELNLDRVFQIISQRAQALVHAEVVLVSTPDKPLKRSSVNCY